MTQPLIDIKDDPKDTPLIDRMEDLPDGVDTFYVADKDPNYYYCWLNAKADNLERARKIWGYEIIGPNHKESALLPPNALGERKAGDVILARMPRERHERIERMKARRAADQVGAAENNWKEQAEKAGLPIVNEVRSEKRQGNLDK